MTTSERVAPAAGRVADVVASLRTVAAGLPPRDGVAVFNRVYLSVTEELARRLDGGFFPDPERTERLGVCFARRYLLAVAADGAGRRPPACWRPLFELRRRRGVRPVQFALAGINAHIGHDLALAVVDTCTELGVEPGAVERDFERVGEVLAALEERVREELMPGPDLLELADPLTHLLGCWSLERAREAAWSAAGILWRLRELPAVCEEFAQRLDAGTGLVNRCLLVPLT
ncbi:MULTISPECIES: DUF5995 family protein [Streptomycetaceae]|uniref:Uncharacterized protein n=1 Tax=Streptantibioticus cattleyicolor (strain ATCC 35852 / DSM 46488 / JCM 4925 / NBRC 14057 / NRRL 8057) TaxID=1003195 RepID=F8K510_STREN|nr:MULTISPECIES: DUF5995 family protein [Streptomycetaceae]AEW97735.1 hypothetical protein SCATT_53640 [Streptantibioticus cattleyicolor NRRL 8057 = DSM 46488]MYS62158.1 hypothetical protein [Streptomyces sp. SID5468]CCB78053.1 conserved protein of unknown function [Streptantibioticus cattleyicolor NRRL 8057 = DSM 46488]